MHRFVDRILGVASEHFHCSSVRVSGLYAGINLDTTEAERDIEYDFIVAPGADPGVIGLRVGGADVRCDESGGLILPHPPGTSISVVLSRIRMWLEAAATCPSCIACPTLIVTFDIGRLTIGRDRW